MEKSNIYNPLFLGGAPRSGTTLLLNLFDSHSEVFTFPVEHGVFTSYFSKRHKAKYFKSSFLNGSGHHTIFSNSRNYNKYLHKLSKEGLDLDNHMVCDNKKFKEYFRKEIKEDFKLINIFDGFVSGLKNAVPDFANYEKFKYAAFKIPFYTEYFAQQISAQIPDARFIHVLRHPYDRYASAKSRWVKKHGKKKFYRPNHVDFTRGHTELSILSLNLAIDNQEKIGKDNYYILQYENLIYDPEKELRKICDWLGIAYQSTLLIPSKFGGPIKSISHFNSQTEKLVANKKLDHNNYYSITSKGERVVHDYMLSFSKYKDFYSIKEQSLNHVKKLWFSRYKNESLGNYFLRLVTLSGFPIRSLHKEIGKNLKNRLKRRIEGDRASISGEL